MFDIFKIIPNRQGTLDHVLIAGGYTEWKEVVSAIHTLQNVTHNGTIFNVGRCTHRKNSNHVRTFLTHTAPLDREELKELLG